MSKKLHLKGQIQSPDGQAPEAAWRSVEEEMKRPEDVWVEGDPVALIDDTKPWLHRLNPPQGPMGLRIRFVLPSSPPDAFDFVKMVTELLPTIPGSDDGLFVHAEVMDGPEPGIYFAYDNRPPALLTQVHLAGNGINGTLAPVPRGPLHVNLLLHDRSQGFGAVCLDGTLNQALEQLVGLTGASFSQKFVHELTLARSDAHTAGISAGIEAVRQERGARGGFSAKETGSRTRPGGVAARDTPPAGSHPAPRSNGKG